MDQNITYSLIKLTLFSFILLAEEQIILAQSNIDTIEISENSYLRTALASEDFSSSELKWKTDSRKYRYMRVENGAYRISSNKWFRSYFPMEMDIYSAPEYEIMMRIKLDKNALDYRSQLDIFWNSGIKGDVVKGFNQPGGFGSGTDGVFSEFVIELTLNSLSYKKNLTGSFNTRALDKKGLLDFFNDGINNLFIRRIDGNIYMYVDSKLVFEGRSQELLKGKYMSVGVHFMGVTIDDVQFSKLEKIETQLSQINQSQQIRNSDISSLRNGSTDNVGTNHALIIGNNNYQDPSLVDLDQPIHDATKLYNTLISKYTFEKENVTFLKDATRRDIIGALDRLSNELTSNDNLIIFYAGHGYWDQDKEIGSWMPTDAEKSITANWLKNSAIQEYLEVIKAKHTLLIADACFGGGIFKTRAAFEDADRSINNLYKYESRKAMTSGMLNEVPDRSIFMENLIERLNNNEEKYLSSASLFFQFRENVMNNSNNAPQYGTVHNTGDKGGDFIFILRNK